MKLNITSSTTIVDFQNEFMRLFPFLKIEFFTKPHERGGTSWSKYMVFNRMTPLSKIENFKEMGLFEFESDMSVGDFEQELWTKFGLSTQVFRKSMGSWIETTQTDKWTLAVQNAKGDESAHTIPEMIYVGRTNED